MRGHWSLQSWILVELRSALTQLACYLSDQGHAVEVFAIGPPPIAGQDHFLRELDAHRIPVAFCSRARSSTIDADFSSSFSAEIRIAEI